MLPGTNELMFRSNNNEFSTKNMTAESGEHKHRTGSCSVCSSCSSIARKVHYYIFIFPLLRKCRKCIISTFLCSNPFSQSPNTVWCRAAAWLPPKSIMASQLGMQAYISIFMVTLEDPLVLVCHFPSVLSCFCAMKLPH